MPEGRAKRKRRKLAGVRRTRNRERSEPRSKPATKELAHHGAGGPGQGVFGFVDDAAHQVAGGDELVDRPDTLTRGIALLVGIDGRVLVAADSVAIEIDQVKSEQNAPLDEALEALEMPAGSGESLLDEVRSDQDNLAGFLTVR